MSPKRTTLAKAKVVVEAATEDVTTATRARHQATRAAGIQVDQWRHRHGCLLSVTGQEGQLVDAGHSRIVCTPSLSTPQTSQASCIILLGSRSNSSLWSRPRVFLAAETRSRGWPVHRVWTFIMLGATCARVGMLVRFWAVCGVRSCHLLLKQVLTPPFV